eukprot:SAG31_NODE_1720_length_7455_cov_3.242115_3_plen_51_part_00
MLNLLVVRREARAALTSTAAARVSALSVPTLMGKDLRPNDNLINLSITVP